MEAVYGLFSDSASAQRAVSSLRASGVKAGDMAVLSSEPLEHDELARAEGAVPMPWLAVLGGLIGAGVGYLLTSLTQKAYPLNTGGMPISPFWTNGIITYELTMLGAVLVTVLALLFGSRLPDWSARLYDPEISDGKILVGVVRPSEALRERLKTELREAGAETVREFASHDATA